MGKLSHAAISDIALPDLAEPAALFVIRAPFSAHAFLVVLPRRGDPLSRSEKNGDDLV